MSDILKMDIFFVVATIAVIALTVFACIALFYLVRILRILERISLSVEEETAALKEDLQEARVAAKTQGKKLLALARAFHRSVKRLLSGKAS